MNTKTNTNTNSSDMKNSVIGLTLFAVTLITSFTVGFYYTHTHQHSHSRIVSPTNITHPSPVLITVGGDAIIVVHDLNRALNSEPLYSEKIPATCESLGLTTPNTTHFGTGNLDGYQWVWGAANNIIIKLFVFPSTFHGEKCVVNKDPFILLENNMKTVTGSLTSYYNKYSTINPYHVMWTQITVFNETPPVETFIQQLTRKINKTMQ